MEWLILWLVFSVACAILAERKRRSGGGWFFLGLLFGPLALLVLLFLSESGVPCPYCGKIIDPEATRCVHCQSEIPYIGPMREER